MLEWTLFEDIDELMKPVFCVVGQLFSLHFGGQFCNRTIYFRNCLPDLHGVDLALSQSWL